MGTQFLWAWNKVSGSEGKSNCSGKSKGLIKTFRCIWFRVQNRGKGQAPTEYVISQMLVTLDHLVDMAR